MIQGFGPRPKPTPSSPAIHYGIDYGWVDSSVGGVGDPVFAAASGFVIDYAPSGAYGNRLRIRIAPGIEIWYCHLHSSSVQAGNTVHPGQQVGLTGTTGNVAAKHLHFELRIGGVAVDPAPYFTTPADGGMKPIEPEEPEMPAYQIIAPYGLPDRGLIAPGFGIAFGNEGDFAHMKNVLGLNDLGVTVIGGPTMSEADRRALFNRIIALMRSGSAPAIDSRALALEIAKHLPTTQVDIEAISAAVVKALPAGGTFSLS